MGTKIQVSGKRKGEGVKEEKEEEKRDDWIFQLPHRPPSSGYSQTQLERLDIIH